VFRAPRGRKQGVANCVKRSHPNNNKNLCFEIDPLIAGLLKGGENYVNTDKTCWRDADNW